MLLHLFKTLDGISSSQGLIAGFSFFRVVDIFTSDISTLETQMVEASLGTV